MRRELSGVYLLMTSSKHQSQTTYIATGAKSEISTNKTTAFSLALKFDLERNKIQTLDSMNNGFKEVCGNFSQERKKVAAHLIFLSHPS